MYRGQVVIILVILVMTYCQQEIPGEYIIGLHPGTRLDTFKEMLQTTFQMKCKNSWNINVTKILYVEGDEGAIFEINHRPEVKYIVKNAVVRAEDFCVEDPAPGCWGLDRIDQRPALPYPEPINPNATYRWSGQHGSGVKVYVLDTGIEVNQTEFGGRAVWGYTADQMVGTDDDNGHGTFCAGIVGSRSYGVAKNVTLVAVKVLDRNGLSAWNVVIDGLVWVLEQHRATDKAVVNMSLGAVGSNSAVDELIDQLYRAGITVVVAAGNSYMDACGAVPASAPNAITVAASDVTDTSATFTNWGRCVDLFAPGVDVLSTYRGGTGEVLSGTSAAAPHVAGVVATYLSNEDGVPTAAEVTSWLLGNGTAQVLNWSREDHQLSPNLLLYVDC